MAEEGRMMVEEKEDAGDEAAVKTYIQQLLKDGMLTFVFKLGDGKHDTMRASVFVDHSYVLLSDCCDNDEPPESYLVLMADFWSWLHGWSTNLAKDAAGRIVAYKASYIHEAAICDRFGVTPQQQQPPFYTDGTPIPWDIAAAIRWTSG
jgi:hypothetical protein